MKLKFLPIILIFVIIGSFGFDLVYADIPGDFANPPLEYKSRPLWFWQSTLSTTGIGDIMQNCRDQSGCGGFGILPCTTGMNPTFMSSGYLARYGDALSKASQLGMHMCLYDDLDFPSGWAGGQLASQYPNATAKRLDMFAADVTGPTQYSHAVPTGTLMGAVAMNNSTKARTDITSSVSGGTLSWSVPSGSYKIMIFTCVTDGWNRVNYLEPSAVQQYISLTYQKYYDNFSSYFGNVIDKAFYDEPTMWWVQGGRMWTPNFNTWFQSKYGYSPVLYYPALWYDIGTDTQAARNALLGYRAELFAQGFIKTINDWCAAHNIKLTGHVDQEEVVNPTGLCGDLMKSFKYQDIPGIDEITTYGRASKAYKIVSSAAYNWDKSLVMSETYGAMSGMPVNTLYKEAMDQYAKGVNLIVPHAVWYDTGNVWYQPELSYRTSAYSAELPSYNNYIGRLNLMLQGGRHVTDIGVLYPIGTLQAGYVMDAGDPYTGSGVIPAEADYMDIGEYLALGVRRDFTFIHPEVFDASCTVSGATINLNNPNNFEQYKVIIIPGSKTISLANLQKIQQFYNNGGKVIATTQLPNKSVEFGHDADVTNIINAMFNTAATYPQTTASSVFGSGYEANKATDGDSANTRWNAGDLSGGNQWLQIDFGANTTFNKTITKEAFNRVTSYNIQYWNGSAWVNCVTGTTIGAAKTDTFTAVTASKVRLYINAISSDSASIYEFEVYNNSSANLALNNSIATKTNANNGKTYFLSSPSKTSLKTALDDALAVYDVKFESDPAIAADGNLSYIHKVKNGGDIYFFANSSSSNVDTYIRLRGNFVPQVWNPHNGTISIPEYSNIVDNGQNVTRVRLALSGVKSVFITGAMAVGPAGYTLCASEGQSYSLPGTCDVAYGANGSYYYKYGVTGNITFNNATFGDPCPNVVKSGYYKSAGTTTPTATSTPVQSPTPTKTPTPTTSPVSFNDNFNDNVIGSAWSFYGSGAWSEQGTIFRQDSTTQGDPCKAILSNSGKTFGASHTILAKVYVNSWADGDSARAGVSLFTGTGNGQGYNLLFHNNHSTVQFLDDGSAWGPSYTFNWTNSTWYWFKLQMSSGVLYGKVWQDGTAEPGNWPYTWTRNGRSGYPALNAGTSGHGGSCTVYFDDVTVTSP